MNLPPLGSPRAWPPLVQAVAWAALASAAALLIGAGLAQVAALISAQSALLAAIVAGWLLAALADALERLRDAVRAGEDEFPLHSVEVLRDSLRRRLDLVEGAKVASGCTERDMHVQPRQRRRLSFGLLCLDSGHY